MRKHLLRIASFCLVLVLLLSTFPLTVFAATTKYETVKDNVPVWSEPSSKSTKVYRIEYEGTVVEVTSSKTNSAGNLWYKLTDGNWVFSGNVKKHSHKGVMCGRATYSYAQKNASTHTVTTKMPDLCSCGHVMGYQTTTGDESHSFNSNNTCTKCGYKKVHTHKLDHLESAGVEYFTQDEDSHVFEEELLEICSCGSALNKRQVQTTQCHEFDSSGKCMCGYTKETPIHTHKGIVCGDPFYSYTAKDREVHYVLEKTPNICECGTVVNFETFILKEEAHRFENDICKDCNVEKSYGVLDVDAAQIVEQAVKGNYSDDVTLAGVVAEILVGEIPFVGTAADVRDVVADIQNGAGFWTTAIDVAALIPVAGGIIKYADEVADASVAAKIMKTRSTKGEKLLKKVTNPKLSNTIKEMYRPGAKIGDGGLADIIKYELKTGTLVGGKSHIIKGQERIRNLERILREQSLTNQEREIALKLIKELKNALGGY